MKYIIELGTALLDMFKDISQCNGKCTTMVMVIYNNNIISELFQADLVRWLAAV